MKDIRDRVNRIIGQLKGVVKMTEEKRECAEILQQIQAIKKAIDSLSKEVVISDICRFIPEEKVEKVQKTIERAINL